MMIKLHIENNLGCYYFKWQKTGAPDYRQTNHLGMISAYYQFGQ
jgi:hypothetical protein